MPYIKTISLKSGMGTISIVVQNALSIKERKMSKDFKSE
mgnify:CR=1 FL=1